MRIKVFATVLGSLLIAHAQADSVGLYFGGQFWQSNASGALGGKNTQVDFNLENEQQTSFFVAVEHPLPFLPNLRIAQTSLDTTGKATLVQALNFGGDTFPISNQVSADVDMSYTDYTLYYEIIDNRAISVDLGLTARDFSGDIALTGSTVLIEECEIIVPDTCVAPTVTGSRIPQGKINIDDIEPMLYAATMISLPLRGLHFFAQGDVSVTGDHSLADYQVGLRYDLIQNMVVDLNLTLGYRAVNLEFEDLDGLYSDLKFKGAFAGMVVHF
ncbi:TIGR04219 family outer membrane beta-barrel protein [Thalassotalea euphylliae]|uniref:TIGR04219 family outer membrane beta-barrel protein n=1 Tax=Thalassotalea euphylliae TaxID=1655234 RepID=A0A3E0UHP2_9GAMM|nr:TIGR04219 family outer membrane beta-barrel protein [Thalassotalea euphylliae]REL36133.1 TIGR04219 family outer membrane beta-barrel protein [Thalassotalea euphylliae]